MQVPWWFRVVFPDISVLSWVPGRVWMHLAILVAPGFRRGASSVKLDRFTGCHYLWGYHTWDILGPCTAALCVLFQGLFHTSYFELFRVISKFQIFRCFESLRVSLRLSLRVFESFR